MFAPHPRGPQPRTTPRRASIPLRRLAAVLAAAAFGLLASVATIPAAFATVIPDPGGQYRPAPAAPVPTSTTRLITAGGMAGWQIALIAVGAALLAATMAVLADRAWAARRRAIPAAA
jgi:hypothetical protein